MIKIVLVASLFLLITWACDNTSDSSRVPTPEKEVLSSASTFIDIEATVQAKIAQELGVATETPLPPTITPIPTPIPSTATPVPEQLKMADIDESSSSNESKIAFTSDRDGNYEIYVMNADGSNQTRMTNHYDVDLLPSWSPDGSKIAFTSYRDGNAEIYVMNADGSNQTRMTNNDTTDLNPSWSPDGSKITFSSDRDGNTEIYVMNADGSNQTRMTNNDTTDLN